MKVFNQIQLRRPKKSKFDLSHERKLTTKMGQLTPVLCQDVMPGDSFRVNTEMLMRLQPLLTPVMHRINATIHFFYVPNRLLYTEWEDWITGGKDGTFNGIWPYVRVDSSNYQTLFGKKTLADYLGLPSFPNPVSETIDVSALPFAAYQKVFDDYYRDSTLQAEVFTPLVSGNNNSQAELFKLRLRNLERDYFTSALPFAQRGPEVTVPGNVNYKEPATYENGGAITSPAGLNVDGDSGGVSGVPRGIYPVGFTSESGYIDNIESLGITIRDLRRSNRLQEWLEKNAVAGGRYVEQILAHFGIHTGDSRVQRSEYLGGGKMPVIFSEVLQTSGTAPSAGGYTETPLGEMGGHGISAGSKAGFKHMFKEHGYVIGLLSVLPVNTYQQGIPRHFMRDDKLKFPWPEFAQIGEQEILNAEIFTDGSVNDDLTFGYQSRYAECKFNHSTVHGDFKDTLNFWHLGRQFATRPALNEDFIKADIDKRIFAVTDPAEDSLLVNIYHDISAIRPLPYFGTPTL